MPSQMRAGSPEMKTEAATLSVSSDGHGDEREASMANHDASVERPTDCFKFLPLEIRSARRD